ncbi:MAG: DUF3006 domain-containing protein [Clostridia bacterium]|nr:DUF3006 domain-containing protein [Clostridia bacterium]
MFFSIDRIEGNVAVCIGDMGQTFVINLDMIDGEPHEGSILFDIGNGRFLCSGAEEDKRRKENAERLERLMQEEQ